MLTVGGSPYGFTITPIGRAISFCNTFVLGILSVVTLMSDLSELYSSSDCVCCIGCA